MSGMSVARTCNSIELRFPNSDNDKRPCRVELVDLRTGRQFKSQELPSHRDEEAIVSWHFLPALSRFQATFHFGDDSKTVCYEMTTPEPPIPDLWHPHSAEWTRFLLADHTMGRWMVDNDDDYFITHEAFLPVHRITTLLEIGAFWLPSSGGFCSIPWPLRPFGFELQQNNVNWLRNKKLRRHRDQFSVTVNADFRASLQRAAQYHENEGGTWISDELVETMLAIHRDAGTRIRVFSFELWDRQTGELAACTFGYQCGRYFQDFTTAVLEKSSRSCGSILTKLVGDILKQCGVEWWYWGMLSSSCAYMRQYAGQANYGGIEIDRESYWDRVQTSTRQDALHDPEHFVMQEQGAFYDTRKS